MVVELGSEHPCCNHTPQFLNLHWCLNFDKCDERYRAEPISSSLATQTIAAGVPTQELVVNKRLIIQNSACRSRMEALLVTTTDGHVRPERARERFAQFAEELGVMESPRKRHRF